MVVCTARQTGKTTAAALMAIHAAYFNENVTVLVASKTYPQALEVMDRMKWFVKEGAKMTFDPLTPKEKESRAILRIKNKGKKRSYSRILSVTATDAARGYTVFKAICDELAFWENGDYVFNQVIEPTTQATDGTIWAVSTPNGQQGVFYNIFKDPFWNAYQFDWHVNPFATEARMERKKSGMTMLEFASEYEAAFVSPRNAYFTQGEIKRATSVFEWKPSSGVVSIGVDIGKHHDNAVIYVGCLDNPKADAKDSVVRVLERIVKPLGTKYVSLIGEIKSLHAKYRSNSISLDATGSGEGPGEFLELEGLPVELVKFSIQKKAKIYSTLKVLMEDPAGRIQIPNERDLLNQLGWMMYEYTSIGNIKIYPPENSHDDEVDALALMAYGLTNLMSAPASMTIVTKPSFNTKPAEVVKSGSKFFYCVRCDDYHWNVCPNEPLLINT